MVESEGYSRSRMAFELPTHHRATGLVDVLDRVLDKGLVVAGDIKVSLAEVELLTIRIRLLICSLDKAQEIGLDWWRYDRDLSPGRAPRALAEHEELRAQIRRSSGRSSALTAAAPKRRRRRSKRVTLTGRPTGRPTRRGSWRHDRERRMAVERAAGGTSLIDVLDRVLDKGIVIDAWVRVSLVGIDLITVEARVVVASIDTYLKYSEAVGQVPPASRPQAELDAERHGRERRAARGAGRHQESARRAELAVAKSGRAKAPAVAASRNVRATASPVGDLGD